MLHKTKIFLLFTLLAPAISLFSQRVTTESLLEEMTDLKLLAEKSAPGYEVIQYSSYDHRSIYPDQPGWFSNSDGFGGEPVPGFEKVLRAPGDDQIGEYLICDVKGPGAIVRLWTAWFEGTIRMYIDDDENPIYDGPAQKLFHHAYEAIAGTAVNPDWAGSFFQNTAGYYPIPFSKSLKIEWEGDLSKLHFYHVQLRLYDQGARVASFKKSDIDKLDKVIDQVSNTLNRPEEFLDDVLENADDYVVHLLPGEKKKLKLHQQSGAIDHLACRLISRDLIGGLKSTLLDIRFDGAPWGQVQSPLGDFFGASPGINPYCSLPFSVQEDGWMISRYFMPYRDSVEVYVVNKGNEEVSVHIKIADAEYHWKEGSSMYFRARWRVDHGLTGDPAAVFDVPYLLYRGAGRMVGAAAFIMNPTNVPSSYGNWWGEGDEKIFIDQDPKAKFIGTGSEDYFNYAWSSSAIFTHSFCGQPRNDGPANRGFVTNYRWHILDNIPFQTGFDFYMELYPHRLVENFSYARMIYLYADGTGHDDHMPISQPDVLMPHMPDNWWAKPDGWALNAIFYQIEDLVRNESCLTLSESYLWSDGELAVWNPEKKGDKLILNIPVTESGKYMLAFTVSESPNSGTIEFLLDGEPLILNGASRHDLSKDFRTVSRNLKSGSIDVAAGEHEVCIVSVDEDSLPVGLDFIWVKRN